MATTTATSPQINATTTSRTVASTIPPIAMAESSSTSTSSSSARLPPMRRISSSARERLSVYSTVSQTSQHRSRPVSHVFPVFHSSLPYALVRDFAYAPVHPLHYGPLPVPSRSSTPASESKRISDPHLGSWEREPSRHSWSSNSGTSDSYGQQLPAVSFADGPPYSEDEDLHSPIITSRYRKHKSMHIMGGMGKGFGDNTGRLSDSAGGGGRGGTLVAVNGDGSETYYVQGDQDEQDGPGGEYIIYPAGDGKRTQYPYDDYSGGNGAGSTDKAGVGVREGDAQVLLPEDGGDYLYDDDDGEYSDRYSRDYHFSIGSPDEEMHGKAVALFDFTREHENELPLKEGQVILVSYRHGQGWLVAEDPKTGESGLVPEEFVRLVRDIEGGLSSLNSELASLANDSQHHQQQQQDHQQEQQQQLNPNSNTTTTTTPDENNLSTAEPVEVTIPANGNHGDGTLTESAVKR